MADKEAQSQYKRCRMVYGGWEDTPVEVSKYVRAYIELWHSILHNIEVIVMGQDPKPRAQTRTQHRRLGSSGAASQHAHCFSRLRGPTVPEGVI